MKETFAKKIVRDAYGNPQVIASYDREIGLWRSEETLIQRFFPHAGDVLDLGCGTGRTSIPLAQMGFRVVGIDLSSDMLSVARLKASHLDLNIELREMDAKTLSFADHSFDAALFSFNGLDHTPGYNEKLKVLRQVFRVLRPGSPFIFSAHRIWSPYHMRRLILSGLRMNLGNIIGFNTLEKEWGDIYDLKATDPEERYSNFLSSKRWKQALHVAGFDLIFCQSRFRLESQSQWEWISKSLSSGNYMFYIARRPIAEVHSSY